MNSENSIRIKRVASSKDLNEFVMLPWRIYKDDPNWVPPLISDVKATLDKTKNPFFCCAERELYIAYKGNEVVGRVAAIIDYHICKYMGNVGLFGLLEVIPDYSVTSALLTKAIEFLKSRGAVKMYGPSTPLRYDECGLLIKGFSLPPVIKMPYNPQYYLDFVERFGMVKAKDLYGYSLTLDKEPPAKLVRVIERLKIRKDITIRPINFAKRNDRIAIQDIYNNAWSFNWEYMHIAQSEIDYLCKRIKPIVVPELALIAEISGEPVGMGIGLPDYNQVFRELNGRLFPFGFFKLLLHKRKINTARVWALGVKIQYQNIGISALLSYEMFIGAKKKGYKCLELSWILEDNIPGIQHIQLWDAKLYKKYRLYQLTF